MVQYIIISLLIMLCHKLYYFALSDSWLDFIYS